MAKKGERVCYEWVVEEIDPDTVDEAAGLSGDIIECYYYDEADYEQATQHVRDVIAEGKVLVDFGLVYKTGDDDDGEQDRQYAYCPRGTVIGLPETFEYGRKVPKRFLNLVNYF